MLLIETHSPCGDQILGTGVRHRFLILKGVIGKLAIDITGDHIKYLVEPTVHTKTYIFHDFYQQYLVLFTMAPLTSRIERQGQEHPLLLSNTCGG